MDPPTVSDLTWKKSLAVSVKMLRNSYLCIRIDKINGGCVGGLW